MFFFVETCDTYVFSSKHIFLIAEHFKINQSVRGLRKILIFGIFLKLTVSIPGYGILSSFYQLFCTIHA